MKAFLALALAGTLLVASGLTARADDFTATKDAYVKQMNDQMADWHQKLDKYSADAKAKGDQAAHDTDKDLRQAWTATKRASRRVAHATAAGWDKAKAAFDSASARLKQDWDRDTSH